MGGCILPSPPSGGEGRAAIAAKGEGGVLLSVPSPRSCVARVDPLPLKGVRGLGVSSQGNQDCPQDSAHVRYHVRVRETNDTIALRFERSGPDRVVRLTPAMRVAVQLDDEALAAVREVRDVRRKNHLPLELYTEAVRSEPVPEPSFGVGEGSPQLFRAGSCFYVPLQTAPSPRSAPQSRPLPLKGARGARHGCNPIESVQTVNA